MLHIVLYEPEIPPNTGSIMRLCANTGTHLNLVEPLGFELDDSRLRRAGLDYREYADVSVHPNLESARNQLAPNRWFAFSAHASRFHTTIQYQADDVLLFGPETRGLPDTATEALPADRYLRLPMLPARRSLNLAAACAVAVYEAWRQLDFPGAV